MPNEKLHKHIESIVKMLEEIKEQDTKHSSALSLYKSLEQIDIELGRIKILKERAINSTISSEVLQLTTDEISALNSLNNTFYLIQDSLLNMYHQSNQHALKWMNSPSTKYLKEFELPIKVFCYIGEDDDEYDQNYENIIAEFDDTIFVYHLKDWTCDCEFGLRLDKPHAFLFHALYHYYRPHLTLPDILRIRTVWAEVHLWKQCEFQIKK